MTDEYTMPHHYSAGLVVVLVVLATFVESMFVESGTSGGRALRKVVMLRKVVVVVEGGRVSTDDHT